MNITEKIKSFEDACTHIGIEPKLPETEGLMAEHAKAVVAFYALSVIASALNEGWTPDWENEYENKYYPYFYHGGPAGGFALAAHLAWSLASAYIAGRLCYKSRELALYAGKQFTGLYRDFILFE